MRLTTIASLLLALAAQPALADKVYRWVDAHGQVHYSDKPAPNAQEIEIQPPETTGAQPESAPPVSDAEAERAALCKQRQAQLESYRNASRIIAKDEQGNPRDYSEQERLQLIERTKQSIKELCGPAPPETSSPQEQE